MCSQNEQGFTLVESLLHCFMFAVVALLLSTLLVISMKIPTTEDALVKTEFEVVSHDFQYLLLEDVTKVRYLSPTSVLVTRQTEKDVFYVLISKRSLFRSKANGVEPLLSNIKEGTQWVPRDGVLTLTIKSEDGYVKERDFYVPTLIQ